MGEETDPEQASTELRDAVKRFEVCWEASPERSLADQARVQIGFVVELYGTQDVHGVVPTAGCKHCIPVLQALLAIADFIVPDAWRDALSAIRAHSGIQYAVERGGRPDIVVAVTMVPRDGARPDPEEIARCLADVKARLARLGACERSWRGADRR